MAVVLFGTCAGTLLQLKRLSRDPDYRYTEGPMRRVEPGHPGPGRLHRRILDRRTAGGLGLIFQSFERFGIPDCGLGVHRHLSVLHFGVPGALQMAPAEDVRRKAKRHEAEHTLVFSAAAAGALLWGRPGRRGRFAAPPLCRGFLALQAASVLLRHGGAAVHPRPGPRPAGAGPGDHDERGAMIRAMARARAGDVLLWLLLFGAAYLYFFGVPKWVNITLLGLACVKLLLELMFTVWYRRQY